MAWLVPDGDGGGEGGGVVCPLVGRTLVGRAASCTLRLDDRRASGEHAVVYWRDGGWWVRDLGSRNGTFVDGERVEVGARAALPPETRLGFGAEGGYVMGGEGPPRALAWRSGQGGSVRAAEGGLLALPDAEAPAVSVYADEGGWRLEADDIERAVDGMDAIAVDGIEWRLWAPSGAGELPRTTLDARDRAVSVHDIGLAFRVSRDEEHVEVTVLRPGGEVALEPRAHHYMLLLLARLRLEDTEASAAEAGYVDSELFAEMLGAAPPKVNLEVFRARRQLAECGVEDAARLVERRPHARQLRIGVGRLSVEAL